MGIIPSDSPIGNDCLHCFAAGETPSALKVFFSGIERGDLWSPPDILPPNGYWDIYQDSLVPCLWRYAITPTNVINFQLSGTASALWITYSAVIKIFNSNIGVKCRYHHTNSYTTPINTFYYGGWGFVGRPDDLQEIIEAVTPLADEDPRMECFPMSNDIIVVRYAGKQDATRASIRFDLS